MIEASRTFVQQLHLIGLSWRTWFQFGQRGKAKPVIVYRRLIRLEHLLMFSGGNPRWPITSIYCSPGAPSNARVETFFVADGGTPIAAIVMGREHQRFIRKREELLRNRVELFAGIAAAKSHRPVPRMSSVSPVSTRSSMKRLMPSGVWPGV